MRLLLLTQDFPPNTGGIETYTYELAKRFNVSAEFFAVLAPTHKMSGKVDRDLDFPVLRVPSKNSMLPLIAPLYLINSIKKHSFDTVFHAQWQTIGASLLAQKLTGYPRHIYVAAHARELLLSPYAGDGGLISRKLHQWRNSALQKADGFFPVSRYTALLLEREKISTEKIHVVGNGTDPGLYYPRDVSELRNKLGLKKKKVIFSVCRLVPRKGMDLVLYALQKVLRHRKDVVYLIGGSGEDEQRLKSLVSEMKLDSYVRFTGRIPESQMADFYSLADVFVMPAKNAPPDVEGFGIVFLEANACGTPVIGSRTGGIPDAVREGETGYLIDEGDVGQLSQLLVKLLCNNKMAKELGEKGRKRILDEATWDHAAESLLKKMELINKS